MVNKIESAEKIFIVGIKGNGTSAIAYILSRFEKAITGSDVEEDFITKPLLDKLLITPKLYGDISSLKEFDLVIYSTSVDETNPDVALAMREHIPCITYPEALGELAKLFSTSIAVCGSHGKSTITSMLGYVLEQGELDPTVLVGAEMVNWHGSARVGGKELFLFEADEYQNKFKHYFPNILVISNINFEHPDFFSDFKTYKNAFIDFVTKHPENGLIVANYDHPVVREIVEASGKKVIWYGENKDADVRLTNRSLIGGGQNLEINNGDTYSLCIIGKHNALNALPVIALAEHFGIDKEKVNQALSKYKSTKRRLELIGKKKGAPVIDDFAHHPTEIVASLSALKEAYPDRRIVCVFQSHTFTRTQVLLSDFATAFKDVDELIMIPIFGSAREKQGTITTEKFVDEIKKHTPNTHIENTLKDAHEYLNKNTKREDLIVTMGAGDTWQLAQALVKD